MIPRLSHHLTFPSPNSASPEGIVAYGGDLSPSRIMMAYRNGIFPWYSAGDPILWWSPNPRLILELDDFKLHNSPYAKPTSNPTDCRRAVNSSIAT